MLYITDKDAVKGSLRGQIYDNEIRIDNQQHAILELRKILKAFAEEDYTPVLRGH